MFFSNIEITNFLVGLIALFIGVAALIYSRRDHILNKFNYDDIKKNQDVFFDIINAKKYEDGKDIILTSEFIVSYNLIRESILEQMRVTLWFENPIFGGILGLIFRRKIAFGLLPYGDSIFSCYSTGSGDLGTSIFDANRDDFRAIIRNPKTKELIDVDRWTKLEPGKAYYWEVVVSFPSEVLIKLEKKEFPLEKLSIGMTIHKNLSRHATFGQFFSQLQKEDAIKAHNQILSSMIPFDANRWFG